MAANEFVQRAAKGRALLGWFGSTLDGLALRLAARPMAVANLAFMSRSSLLGIVTRVVARLAEAGRLGRFEQLADKPGFPNCLANTWQEMRMARVDATGVMAADGDLAAILTELETEARGLQLADRARAFALAIEALEQGALALGAIEKVVLLDVLLRPGIETDFVRALIERANQTVASVPAGDDTTTKMLLDAGLTLDAKHEDSPENVLEQAQNELF